MSYVKVGVIVMCFVNLVACSSTLTNSISTNAVLSSTSSESSNNELSQIVELNGLKVAFPSQWVINRSDRWTATPTRVWELSTSLTTEANDEVGMGGIFCPINIIVKGDNPSDIREQRSITKNNDIYDLELNMQAPRFDEVWQDAWAMSTNNILLSKRGSSLQDKETSCIIQLNYKRIPTSVEKDLLKKIYQSIQ